MISGTDCLKDIMKRYKDACRRFLKRPAEFLIRRLPEQVRESLAAGVRKRMEGQYADTEQQMQLRVREFLVKEGMLVFWGMAVLAVMLASLAIYRFVEPPSLIFERNSFGEGEKEVSVILQNGEQEREYALTLGERELSQEEERTLKDRFFDELEEEMAGENVSLRQVNRELCFADTLSGWPFLITYEPADGGLVRLDGSLGEKSAALSGDETADTRIAVRAEYGPYIWEKDMTVRLTAQEKKNTLSPFDRAVRRLQQEEKKTRSEKTYAAPSRAGEIAISREPGISLTAAGLLGTAIVVLLLLRNVSQLNNGEKACRKETLRDFPLIVHLLTLYMGAGLSFPSAVHRISLDYTSRTGQEKKYAFEEILRMDARLQLGEGQQEACMQWGRRFQEPVYQKLSLTLLQVMTKGTREGRMLMSHMEQESFRQRLDQARTEGEEASTKLLFPMILLLGMVMILVMFPAIVRFQGF